MSQGRINLVQRHINLSWDSLILIEGNLLFNFGDVLLNQGRIKPNWASEDPGSER
jgi:hypothetical protein